MNRTADVSVLLLFLQRKGNILCFKDSFLCGIICLNDCFSVTRACYNLGDKGYALLKLNKFAKCSVLSLLTAQCVAASVNKI